MSEVVYAYTSKGRKEKCGKGGVQCVRHPVHITGKAAQPNNWFGNGVIANAMAVYEQEYGDSASIALEDYNNATNAKRFEYKDIYDADEADAIIEAGKAYRELAVKMLNKKGFEVIRTEGLGSNFKVLNPKDAGRGDDAVWSGKCDTCGGSVTSSRFGQGWTHNVSTPIVINGVVSTTGRHVREVYACPSVM